MTTGDSTLLNDSMAHAASVLRSSSLRHYRVRLVSSGFGDMLTVANLQAAVGELLGLSFQGLTLPASFSRPYYDELVKRLGLLDISETAEGDPEIVLDEQNLVDPQHSLAAALTAAVANKPGAETLLIAMRSIAAAQGIQGFDALREPFFRSGMRSWFMSRGHALFSSQRRYPSVTIHLRLGDVAAVRLGGFVVIPEFAKRETHPAGVVRHAALDRTPFAKKTFALVDDCLAAARQLKQHFPGVRLNLVSDGFDRTRYMLLDPQIRRKLQAKGVEFREEQLDTFIRNTESRIRDAGTFDQIVFGEASTDDWLATVNVLLGSAVVASTARGFVANVLTFFADSCKGMRFYSPLGTGIYSDLSVLGLEQRRFVSFQEFVRDLAADPVSGLTAGD